MSAKVQGTILFLDDESSILSSLKRLLQGAPYGSVFIDDPQKALDYIKENEVSVVVSDYRMPGMDGVQFLRRVREIDPNIVRVILSGYADRSAIIESTRDECTQQFITKPWNKEDLRNEIDGLVRYYDWQKAQKRAA